MNKLKNFNLIVIASTYPRWPKDTTRAFVQDYVKHVASYFKQVKVVAPHYAGAKRRENPTANIHVRRFVYAWPFRFENIAYGEFKRGKGYLIKTALYTVSEFWTAVWTGLRSRPLILNAHWLIPQGFVAVLLKPLLRCKVVISVHGADIYTLKGKFMKIFKRFALKHADTVIVNSSATKAVCERLLPREYKVIPMGVDTAIFQPRPFRPIGETLEILFVGRLSEQKGTQYLCQAAKLLKDSGIPAHVTIIGDGDYRAALEAYVSQNGLESSVSFIGGVPHENIASYYQKADALVGPSIESKDGWQEAFGLVFAEASATGLPVIATDTGGIKDIVHDGANGLIVTQKDAEAIAQAIIKLRDNPQLYQAMAKAGPDLVRDNYSWQAITSKYAEVFSNIV